MLGMYASPNLYRRWWFRDIRGTAVLQNLIMFPSRIAKLSMQVVCLPYGCDAAHQQRMLASAPNLTAICLPAGAQAHQQWLLNSLKRLNRDLFLKPELQVLMAIAPQTMNEFVTEVVRQLCDAHLDTLPIACTSATATPEAIVEWLARGETLRHAQRATDLDDDALLVAAYARLGAAPLVEANESSARLILTSHATPGALVMAAIYPALQIEARDWNHLAQLQLLAQVAEQADAARPVWIDIGPDGDAYLRSPPQTSADPLSDLLQVVSGALADADSSVDVRIDARRARFEPVAAGQFRLTGVKGEPPAGRLPVQVAYRPRQDEPICLWPTSVARKLVDWDAEVRPAADWL